MSQTIKRLSDLKVKIEHTQVIQHMVGLGSVFDLTVSNDSIDLDRIVESLIQTTDK